MLIRSFSEIALRCIAVCTLMLMLAPVGVCQTEAEENGENASSEPIEEITVYGDKPLTVLTWQYNLAKEDFYDVYNSININRSFHVDCKTVNSLGSRRSYLECLPKYLRRYQSIAGGEQIVYTGSQLDADHQFEIPVQFKRRAEKKAEEMRQEIMTMMTDHPELREVFADFAKVRQEYKEELEKRSSSKNNQ